LLPHLPSIISKQTHTHIHVGSISLSLSYHIVTIFDVVFLAIYLSQLWRGDSSKLKKKACDLYTTFLLQIYLFGPQSGLFVQVLFFFLCFFFCSLARSCCCCTRPQCVVVLYRRIGVQSLKKKTLFFACIVVVKLSRIVNFNPPGRLNQYFLVRAISGLRKSKGYSVEP
jgi:hypothetical protein